MKRFLIILIAIFLTLDFTVRAQQTNIWSYNIEDGLVNNDVLNIYQDSRGFIWLCTRGGISRYDGSRFTNFTTETGLTNDMINDICEVAPQEFIIAQNSGGLRLLKNDRISPLSGGNDIIVNRFYSIKNRLVGTSDNYGIVEWNQSTFRQVNPSYKESTGRMTAINDSSWLLIHPPSYIQYSSSFLKNWSALYATDATTVFTDSQNRTWLGTPYGLKLVDANKNQSGPIAFLPLPPAFDIPILEQAYISEIMEDSQANLWFATVNGLVRIDNNGQSTVYTQKDGLPASQINCFLEDREKNIWIGTTLGLAKFSVTNIIRTFRPELGPSHDGTLGMLPLTENTWRIFDGKKTSLLNLITGMLSNDEMETFVSPRIYQLNKDELVLAKGEKAQIYHSGRERIETISWPNKIFGAVIRKDAASFLGAFVDTLFVFTNGTIREVLKTGISSYIHRLAIDKKNQIWAGTWDQGLMKIGPVKKGSSDGYKVIDTIAGRLPDKNIRAVYINSKNEIWIGMRYKGLSRIIESSTGNYEIQNYGTREGLSSDFVLTISEDSLGNMWVGSIQGIDKLIPERNHYRIFNYGKVNKIFSRVYDIKFASNNYLQATGNPYLLYVRDMQQDTLPAPAVYITRVASRPADSPFVSTTTLHLPTNKAQIYFEFSAPQFINEDYTKFSYRLLGAGDTSWILSGKSHNVYFASLKPGSYTFEIRAKGFNDQWGKASSYKFIVNTPFWQKAWFIALMIVIAGLLAYAVYRYRVRQLLHVQKVRNRIAGDLHDEIGSNLTNINILSMLSRKNITEPQKAGEFLKRISDEVSSSSQALDDIIWSVNTSHDTLEETTARMRRYAAELFDASNISYELDLDPAFEAKKIGMEQRRDFYLLYKEAVNNISKHANATHVSIQVAIEKNQLLLSVKDNGKGFDIHKETERHGLEGMKARIKKWEGKLRVDSNINQGTFVQVSLPLER